MTIKTLFGASGLALAALIAGTSAQAASLTPIGTDRGAVLVNLSGERIKAPTATSGSKAAASNYVNVGTDRGGVIRNFGKKTAPSTVRVNRTTDEDRGYTNFSSYAGGPIFKVK